MHFICVPAGNNDGLLAIPGWVISHDFSMCGDILGRQLRRFIRLGVDPTKWLHFLHKKKEKEKQQRCVGITRV